MLEMAVDVRRAVADEREPIPAEIPRHGRDQRPKIRTVEDPTRLVPYYRPSSFGDRIEPTFALDRRADRLVVAAFARFPELGVEAEQAVARATRGGEDWDDVLDDKTVRRELEILRDQAIEVMGGNRRAEAGTLFHELRHVLDTEGPNALEHLTDEDWERLAAWSKMARCFTWHGSEQFVVTDRWGTAGTYDALWSPRWTLLPPPEWECPPLEPGQRVIVDLKSGAWVLRYGEIARCIQLTQYPNGVPYVHLSDDQVEDMRVAGVSPEEVAGRFEWLDGVAPRADVALIPHVPHDRPQDAGLIWVNLKAGAELSDTAVAVQKARRMVGSLFAPCDLPTEAAVVATEVTTEISAARTVEPEPALEMAAPPPDGHEIPGCGHEVLQVHCDACAAESARRLEQRTPRGVQLRPRSTTVMPSVDARHLEVLIRNARVPSYLGQLYERHKAEWTPEHGRLADQRLAELTAAQS